MPHFHAVVWIDHHEARVFHFNADDVDRTVVHPDHPAKHLHHKAGVPGPGREQEDAAFYRHAAEAVADAGEILVVGPGQAKLLLLREIHRHHHAIEPRVVGIETVDHPTDNQLVAYARKYFRARDRMLPQGAR